MEERFYSGGAHIPVEPERAGEEEQDRLVELWASWGQWTKRKWVEVQIIRRLEGGGGGGARCVAV